MVQKRIAEEFGLLKDFDYRFLEHTSDIYIEAYGGDLEEAFEEAGKALYAVLVRNIEGVSPQSNKLD